MTVFSGLLILAILFYQQSNTWNGITPIKSTQEEVEKIIGKPESKDSPFYRTKNERIMVLYSTGNCNIKPSNGWNIEKGKVIRISVIPTVKPKFSDYKFDKSKYYHYVDPHISFVTTYTNKEDGVGFSVNTDSGEIEGFYYFPKSKDDYLICKEF
jgi:hypothetical protein